MAFRTENSTSPHDVSYPPVEPALRSGIDESDAADILAEARSKSFSELQMNQVDQFMKVSTPSSVVSWGRKLS